MKQQDLRASAIIAAAWLIGMAMYSIWSQPAYTASEGGIYNLEGVPSIAADFFADDHAPKHDKLPVRWAHQRWGAV
ncbi:MAG TPA: hypothetical protein VMF53_04530 [Alphaproteobacteria bacterium]|nr:hypothetical protein [Alphaproteobacteria bacterium]